MSAIKLTDSTVTINGKFIDAKGKTLNVDTKGNIISEYDLQGNLIKEYPKPKIKIKINVYDSLIKAGIDVSAFEVED